MLQRSVRDSLTAPGHHTHWGGGPRGHAGQLRSPPESRSLSSPAKILQKAGLRPFAANQLATQGVRSLQELSGRSDSELMALGLRAEDIELIRRSGP